MMFSNILLVLDSAVSNSTALRRAADLARNVQAKLTVCEVVNTVPKEYLRTITAITPGEMSAAVIAATSQRLEKAVATVATSDIAIEIKVLIGKPAVQIARQVRSSNHDLVIMSSSRSPCGSVRQKDRELVRACPCPVWLVSASDQVEKDGILAALGMPDDATVTSALNQKILDISRSLALAEFRPLHVVHYWHLLGEGHVRARGSKAVNEEVDRIIVREHHQRMNWLRETVNSTQCDSQRLATEYLDPDLHVIKGDAKVVVPDLANKLGAGLVVMGAVTQGGPAGFWLANAPERVWSRADCSLLVVKQQESVRAPAPLTGLARRFFSPGKSGSGRPGVGL